MLDFDWQSEAWARGWAVTHPKPERKARRAPLPEGLTKRECKRRTVALLAALPLTKAGAMEAKLSKARCFRCGRCSLAPRSI